VKWYEALPTVFAAVAAIGACAAAWATKRATEAQILLQLVNDYAVPQMAQGLRVLDFGDSSMSDFASAWELALARGDPSAKSVDCAHRQVTSYFQNVDELWQNGLISRKTARAAADKAGPPGCATRLERLGWQIMEREKRLAEVEARLARS
jgi:hypothetical protein